MKNKKMIILAGAVVLVMALLMGLYVATRPETAQGAKAFTVTVVHGDGSEKTFSYNTDQEFLGDVLVAEGLIAGEMGPYGMMISTVDGEDAIWEESGAYWALYVGEEYGTTGVDTTPVYDGSVFKLVYTVG